jgi:hypothetical protein
MTTAPMIIGIDLGKNWFHLIGIDERGGTVLRRKMNRTQLAAFAVTACQCVVATEACPGSQYWGRIFATAGHEVRILPCGRRLPYEATIPTAWRRANGPAGARTRLLAGDDH